MYELVWLTWFNLDDHESILPFFQKVVWTLILIPQCAPKVRISLNTSKLIHWVPFFQAYAPRLSLKAVENCIHFFPSTYNWFVFFFLSLHEGKGEGEGEGEEKTPLLVENDEKEWEKTCSDDKDDRKFYTLMILFKIILLVMLRNTSTLFLLLVVNYDFFYMITNLRTYYVINLCYVHQQVTSAKLLSFESSRWFVVYYKHFLFKYAFK